MQISLDRSEVKGRIRAPSSKSYTIRGLMCAALAQGRSELRYPLESDDTAAASRVLSQIGVRMGGSAEICFVEGDNFAAPADDLYCRESAATLRFMSAICAAVPGRSRLTAAPSLMKRPIKVLVEALGKWGIDIESQGETTPVVVNGGHFRGGVTELPGDISSQYISALLLIAPRAENRATIWLTTPLESRSYILMTIDCLRQFGIEVRYSDEMMEYEILPQAYRPAQYTVEGDWSSASYLVGLAATAGELEIENLSLLSLQGDKIILDLVERMGGLVHSAGNKVKVATNKLKAIKTDLSDAIDLLPTLAVLAALADGVSEFTGIQRARLKESDRVKTIREGLEAAGIRVIEESDRLTIRGGRPIKAVINAANDHRIAMAFSLLGAAAGGITIRGAECVAKTYPGYWESLRNLGVKIYEQ
jgi:3-phosphoshikimate 1-carboxyvinyltransferase